MKRFTLIFILFFVLAAAALAQAPGWLWAKNAGGIYDESAYAVATDGSDNAFIAGYFSSPSLTFGTYTLTNLGAENVFIAKYNANGSVAWAKSAGGTYYDDALAVAADASGNAYLTGYFGSSTITFGSKTLNNNGSYDIFLAKYDQNGNVAWATSAGGNLEDEANSVALDPNGNIFLAGHFISVPGITFGTTTLTNQGGADIFLTKYNSGGNVVWAKGVGGDEDDFATSVATDPSGNSIVAGYFNSFTIVFGSFTLTNASQLVPMADVFIAKYDVNGNVLWAKSAGGTDDDEALSVATDISGNVYVTGYFSSSHITFGTYTLTNVGGENIFLVKYDPNGNVTWAKSVPGSDNVANSLTTDNYNNAYLTGYFSGSNTIFGTDTLNCLGTDNIFVAKYNSNGNVQWAQSAGGTGDDMAYGVAMGTSGNLYLSGYFSSSPAAFGSINLTNAGSTDIFIAKTGIATGIQEVENSFSISVYPNPASGIINFTGTKLRNGNLEINIYNTVGALVRTFSLKPEQRQVDLGDLTNGVYFVSIRSGDGVSNQKLLIQR